jgi:hypothetical protein
VEDFTKEEMAALKQLASRKEEIVLAADERRFRENMRKFAMGVVHFMVALGGAILAVRSGWDLMPEWLHAWWVSATTGGDSK